MFFVILYINVDFCFCPQQKGNFVNVVRKAQAAAWEEKFMAMKAKQKESNKVSFKLFSFSTRFQILSVLLTFKSLELLISCFICVPAVVWDVFSKVIKCDTRKRFLFNFCFASRFESVTPVGLDGF